MDLELNEQQQHQHDGIDDNNSIQHDNDSNNNDSNNYSTATNTTSQIDPQQQQSSVKVNKKYKYKADRQQSVKWTQEEDISLLTIVHEHGPKNWKKIAELLGAQRTGNVYTHIQAQCNNNIVTLLCKTSIVYEHVPSQPLYIIHYYTSHPIKLKTLLYRTHI